VIMPFTELGEGPVGFTKLLKGTMEQSV
jgi:hypothetical protein